MNQYEILGCLGKGSYGTVLKIKRKSDQDEIQYAMKILKSNDKTIEESILTEKRILKTLKSPFIVELICDFRYRRDHCLVLEYVRGGDLNSLLRKYSIFSEEFASFYMEEIILGIEYLHDNKIVHGDIKPNNILIDDKGHIKIIDFGVSGQLINGKLLRGKRGTVQYMAPEILLGNKYGTMVDWWSVGVLLYRMLVGRLPFKSYCKAQEYSETKLVKRMLNDEHLQHIPPTLSKNAVDFLINLLTVNPYERLGYEGANCIKRHNFFDNTDWNTISEKSKTPPYLPSLIENTSNVSTFTTEEKIEYMNNNSIGIRFKNHFGFDFPTRTYCTIS